jgi:hypothetical protein
VKAAVSSLLLIAICLSPGTASAHSGRTDSGGGHNCYVGSCAGTYHFHSGVPKISAENPGTSPDLVKPWEKDRPSPAEEHAPTDRSQYLHNKSTEENGSSGRTVAVVIAGIALVLFFLFKGRSSS